MEIGQITQNRENFLLVFLKKQTIFFFNISTNLNKPLWQKEILE